MGQLEDYIKKEIAKGFTQEEILEKLLSVGYKEEQVKPLLTNINNARVSIQEKHNPKFIIMVLAVLLIIVLVLGAFFFFQGADAQQTSKENEPKSYTYDEQSGLITIKTTTNLNGDRTNE